ncbi:RNA 2',3'-cyclic phosphodiesterase [Streptomyces sp. NBC_01551]|uniref:RNA 2',3'-cyclic phosphodiesterase n=1 Tax=Streptomyces sp. NBC_01551 TaxID=2975876 RepID=UPI00225AC375|nr:RNA 2',3'-cyclic phosphodiesterase [Streptomyces sp. NBC_01551]MCX4526502.1 RNA 2',3'-cyclic phosphodiesterase [Streptomyces sp. NBC_01551]
MRLFAAVLPPAQAVAELREAVRALPADDRLRWTAEAGWHFTLAFMGEVHEEVLPDLHERLRRAAARTAPFALRLHSCGHFGDRALWTGAAGELDALRMLAERADAAARRAGVPMEQHRRYTPHLTLARSSHAVDLAPYLEALRPFEGTRWQVGELSLVRSNLPTSGIPGERPRYEVVAAWPLKG